jgi:cytoskeletal protein CcmA (bactofilin family)
VSGILRVRKLEQEGAMFRKMKQSKLLPTQEKFDTLIGATTEIYGRLVLLDSVRIDGKVIGNIETAKEKKVTVAIGRSGEVSGDITAHRVMVAGKVEGNIYANERAEFHKDSEVRGDITYGTIGVEHGAKLLGLVIQAQNNTSTTDAQTVIKMAQEKK